MPMRNGVGEGNLMANLFNSFFGCGHSNYTFPITTRPGSRRNSAAMLTGTYVVCLDCGKEFPYDWQEMKVVTSSAEKHHRVHSLAPKEAA
jgi:hypothetical protein